MPWTRYTLANLRLRLVERVESVPFWTSEEARLALNEGLLLWNLLTGTWKRRVLMHADPSSDPFMALPASLVFGTRVAYLGRPLVESSLPDLFRGRPGWWTEKTTTGGDVPTRPMLWAPVSLTLIAVWPRQALFTANAYQVDGVAETPQLIGESDAVDLEDGVLDVLLGYALHTLTFKEGWARFATTSGQMQAFLALAAEQNSQLSASAFYRAYMGRNSTRDLVPTRGVPERLSPAVASAGSPDG